jgi:hypothetical protein
MGIMPRPNSKNGTEHLTSSHAERDNKILESEGLAPQLSSRTPTPDRAADWWQIDPEVLGNGPARLMSNQQHKQADGISQSRS